MPQSRLKARLDLLIWVLIYLGLFAAVLGIASRHSAPSGAWALMVGGSAVSAIGAMLIWVRSRLDHDA